MKVQYLRQGYAHTMYKVTAEPNEQLTKEMVEERMCYPFGGEVTKQGDGYLVKVYTD